MSYCRLSEDSEVYCYGMGSGWEIHVRADRGDARIEMNRFYETQEETLSFLLGARERGFKVPQCAVDRLIREIEENK